MGQNQKIKPTAEIVNVKIIPASFYWKNEDGYVAHGTCVADEQDRGFVGHPVRTSKIVSFDPVSGVIETENTLYKIANE